MSSKAVISRGTSSQNRLREVRCYKEFINILRVGQDKADRAEARHSKRASRAKAEHSRRGGRAKPGNTLCKNNNCSGEAAAQPPKAAVLLFLQSVLPGLALPSRLACCALARLARLLCRASISLLCLDLL